MITSPWTSRVGFVGFVFVVSKMSWEQVYGQVWMKIIIQWKAAGMAAIVSCVHKDKGDEKKCSSLLTELVTFWNHNANQTQPARSEQLSLHLTLGRAQRSFSHLPSQQLLQLPLFSSLFESWFWRHAQSANWEQDVDLKVFAFISVQIKHSPLFFADKLIVLCYVPSRHSRRWFFYCLPHFFVIGSLWLSWVD